MRRRSGAHIGLFGTQLRQALTAELPTIAAASRAQPVVEADDRA